MDCTLFFRILLYVLIVSTSPGNPLIATNKLSLATWGSYHQQNHKGPGTYAFGYDIEDSGTGNLQFKQEERHPNGTVTGNYGFVDADGKPYVIRYESDENGYRAKLEIEGEPTKYFPDMFRYLQRKPTLRVKKLFETNQNYFRNEYNIDSTPEQNLLAVPLRGEIIRPDVSILKRLNNPSY